MTRRHLRVPLPTARELALGAVLGAVASLPVLRTWSLQWGTTEDELDATLPGDALVPLADHTSTRAVDIRASREQVWPWLVQMGLGRGGFYSYDALENLLGLDITSADRVEERWQDLAVGDAVHLAPELALRVAALDPARAMVWSGSGSGSGSGAEAGSGAAGAMPFDFSWAFVLTEPAPGRTRLVVRERYRYRSPAAALLVEPVSMVSFLMSAKMLRGVRDRAEGRL